MRTLASWLNKYPKKKYPYFNSFVERFTALTNGLKDRNITDEQTKAVFRDYYRKFPLDLIYSGQMTIIDPTPKEMPLIPMLRPPQMDILEITAKHLKEDKPLYITIPKSRKEGISTIIEAIFLALTVNIKYMHALVVADKKENTENIFNKTKFMYDNLDDYVKPKTKKDKTNQLTFVNGSDMIISTARVSEAGRGWDFQLIHFSEVAYFPNSYTDNIIKKSILNTLPTNVFVMVVFESTGNGEGGFFYDICMNAKNKKNDYVLYFISWFNTELNKIPLEEEFKFNKIYGDEKALIGKYNLTYEQLNFRRYKLRNTFEYDVNKFNLEYPSELKDCFQPKSQTAFDVNKLNIIDKFTTPPIAVGYLDNKNEFVEDPKGWLLIWKFPEEGWRHRYVIGADTGGMFVYNNREADYSVAITYDRLIEQDVAMIRGHYKPLAYAKMLIQLGYFYNKAKLAIEVNKWESEKYAGASNVLMWLSKTLYPNFYYRIMIEEGSTKRTKKLGFHTNVKTRPIIMDFIDTHITYCHSQILANEDKTEDDFVGRINNHRIIQDIKAIRFNPETNKYEAQGKDKDDTAIAYGISLVVAESMSAPYKNEGNDKYAKDNYRMYRTTALPKLGIKTRGVI